MCGPYCAMAVRLEHPYRQYLDDQRSLCPERKMSGKSHERARPGFLFGDVTLLSGIMFDELDILTWLMPEYHVR